MLVKPIAQITDEGFIETAWHMYEEAFRDLNRLAVQRHLMHRYEFEEVMRDQRVTKYLCLEDNDRLVGISTFTNDLDAVPLIAPEYFEHHWPDLFAARKIWYIGFLAVDPDAQGRQAFAQLAEQMYMVAAAQDGLVGLDLCNHNNDVRHMSRVLRIMARRLGRSRLDLIDQQSYWLYRFGAAA
jgi:ribosomal protein S18 acetylase RimI-like enzyme